MAQAKARHVRRRSFGRLRHATSRLLGFLNGRASDLATTAASQNFTATASIAASGTLTLTGLPLEGETVTVGMKTYTFQGTLTEIANNVVIGADEGESLDNLIAAINRSTRGVAATGVLTLTGQPLDTETVTVGGTTYTFQTSLVDEANNVLIGATASDSLDNLIAAINADAGAGTLYGTGTVANASATAAAGAGDTMDLTSIVLGPTGNDVATTETLTNGSFGAATLEGGFFRYASDTVQNQLALAAAGAGDTMDVTARTAGVAGNSIVTTEDLTNGSWGAATLESGAEASFTAAAHGFSIGEGPVRVANAGGALPAGLSADADYWVGVIDANTFSLHNDPAAVRDDVRFPVTDTGTGTQSVERGEESSDMLEWHRQRVKPRRLAAVTDVDDLP